MKSMSHKMSLKDKENFETCRWATDLIIQNIEEGIVAANVHGKVVLWNKKAKELSNPWIFKIGSIVGNHSYDFYRNDCITPFPPEEFPLVKAISGKCSKDVEIFLKKEGRFLRVKGIPIYDDKKSLIGGVAIFDDITEKKKIQEELGKERKKDMTTSKLIVLGEMAGEIAHEINTPLGTISLLTGRLKSQIKENKEEINTEKIFELCERIENSVENTSKIIRGLKNLSRNTSDKFIFADLSSILDESLTICESKLRNLHIDLIVGDFPRPLEIQCYPSQLAQTFIGLINNARDAIKSLDEKWIKIEITSNDQEVAIRVTDSGGGIDKEIRKSIFEPFFTTKHVGYGTGLGLSIIHNIVKYHNGTIIVDDDCLNTSFLITLPKFQQL